MVHAVLPRSTCRNSPINESFESTPPSANGRSMVRLISGSDPMAITPASRNAIATDSSGIVISLRPR